MFSIIKKSRRPLSMVLAAVFCVYTCLESAPPAHAQAAAISTSAASAVSNALEIPASLGRVTEEYQGSRAKEIIFIQDAHASLEAQENIAGLIDLLVEKHDIRYVFEEGYQGEVPSDTYFNIDDLAVKEKVSHFFLDHLRIGGAEYAHINRKTEFKLIGAEDSEIYLQCLKQYERAARVTSLIRQDILRIQKHLSVLETALFPKPFYHWWKQRKSYLRDQLPLTDYILRTIRLYEMDGREMPAESFPSLAVFERLTRFGDLNREQKQAVDDLIANMDAMRLFREMEQMEDLLAGLYLKNSKAGQLYGYSEALELIERLSRLEISKTEYDLYQDSIASLKTEELLGFIRDASRVSVLLSRSWEEHIGEVIKFYELAFAREEVLRSSLQGNWEKAVLVFGGFHKEGLLHILRDAGYSYAVITPSMTDISSTHEERYRSLMSGKVYEFERVFWNSDAAKVRSLYFVPQNRFQNLLSPLVNEFDPAGVFSELTEPSAEVARDELRSTDTQSTVYFSSSVSLRQSLGDLDKLLRTAHDKEGLTGTLLADYSRYLAQAENLENQSLKPFIEGLLPILDQHVPEEHSRFSAFNRILEALESNPGAGRDRIRTTLRAADLKLDARGKYFVKESFKKQRWGRFYSESFLYSDLRHPALSEIIRRPERKKPAAVLKKLQKHFEYSPEELAWFIQNTLPGRDPRSLSVVDLEQLHEAMTFENNFIQETRLGGFRRVKGRQRFDEKPKAPSLWRPGAKELAVRLDRVYGISGARLNGLVRSIFGDDHSWNDLSDRDRMIIYERLDKANKTRFARTDLKRYHHDQGLIMRIINRPVSYWRTFKERGILSAVARILNEPLLLAFGLLIRMPMHLFEIFFLRYQRAEILYEHVHRDKDFLGQARTEVLLKNALTDIHNKKIRLGDRIALSPLGWVSRLLDRILIGSIFKATLQFVVKKFYMAVISAVILGVLALLGAPFLSQGAIVSLAYLEPLTAGMPGVGSLIAGLKGIAIIGNLNVNLTVGSIAQSFLMSLALVLPMHVVMRYQHRRLVSPQERRIVTLAKVFLIDTLLSPGFYKRVAVSTVTMLLIGAEISAIVQYAVGLDTLFFGSEEEIPVEEITDERLGAAFDEHAAAANNPLYGLIHGKMHVDGVEGELKGKVFTRGAAFIEHDAMGWGNQILNAAQNQLGFNLSDWVYHEMGGRSDVSANEVMQAANILAHSRSRLFIEQTPMEAVTQWEREAAVLSSRFNQDQVQQRIAAAEFVHRNPEDAVRVIGHLNLRDIGILAGEYAKEDYQGARVQTAVIGELLKDFSYEKYVAYRLSFLAGRVREADSEENRLFFMAGIQDIAASEPAQEPETLRALATVLDDLEPEAMAHLLQRAGRLELIAKVFEEAPLVNVTRKGRLLTLQTILFPENDASERIQLISRLSGGALDTATISLIERDLLSGAGEEPVAGSIYGLSDHADALGALIEYAAITGDERAASVIKSRYERLLGLQNANGSFMTGESHLLSRMDHGIEAGNLASVYRGDAGTLITGGESDPRNGYIAGNLRALRNGAAVRFADFTDTVQMGENNESGTLVLSGTNAGVDVWQAHRMQQGRYAAEHAALVRVKQAGDYMFGMQFEWQASEAAETGEGGLGVWLPEQDLVIDADSRRDQDTIDLTFEVKESGRFVVFGHDKGIVYDFSEAEAGAIDQVILTTKEAGGRRVIDNIRFTFKHDDLETGAQIRLPNIRAAVFWAPMASATRQLGGDGDRIPDDLQQLLPQWTQMMAAEQGDFQTYRTDGDFALAGHTLFQSAKYFEDQAKAAALRGDADAAAEYTALSEEAEARGMRAAEYGRRLYRSLLNQDEFQRTYARGNNYAHMIQLFDDAFEMTGDEQWYDLEAHAAGNLIENQIQPTRKVFPEFEERLIRRYQVRLNGASVDLFDALRTGVEGYRLSVTGNLSVAPFEVGFNEELNRMVVEDDLEVIGQVTIRREDGTLVDVLDFNYDAQGILRSIQSTNDTLIRITESLPVVSKVTVYHNDLKTGIPSGIVYRYVHNDAGELQYIVKEDRITIEGSIQRHPIHIILKASSGEILRDIDIPEGVRPDYGIVRADERLDAHAGFEHLGRTLESLARLRERAEDQEDWKLAARAQTTAHQLIRAFYSQGDTMHVEEDGQFFFYEKLERNSGALEKVTASTEEQAHFLLGLARWTGEMEQAQDLFEAGMRFLDESESSDLPVSTALIKARMYLAPEAREPTSIETLTQGLGLQTLNGLERYIRYGENTTNFKFANVNIRALALDDDQADAVFLNWEPIPHAAWYLVREYRQGGGGAWEHISENDKWVSSNQLVLEDPQQIEKRYVVIGFTADPIFESYGPYHATRSLNPSDITVDREAAVERPGKPHIILPERHLVGNHEEWVELGRQFKLRAREFRKYPHARSAEWEIATDKDFNHVVHRVESQTEIPEIYLRGLQDGDYYARLRFWSGTQSEVVNTWLERGNLRVEHPDAPKAVVHEDLNNNGVLDENEIDLNGNGALDSIHVRDGNVIAWTPAEGAQFYQVRLWYQDGEIERYDTWNTTTQHPFIHLYHLTSHPVNRIEITPYSADPALGGIAGPGTGVIELPETGGAPESEPVQHLRYLDAARGHAVTWDPYEGAKHYRIQTMARSGLDEREVETYGTDAPSRYYLKTYAKYVRIQPWSDDPVDGGRPLADYSEWVEINVEFERPDAVDSDSVQIADRAHSSGVTDKVLTFEPVAGVEGYSLFTKNRRGGEHRYWVDQPPEGERVSVSLVMDADQVEIQASTRLIHGIVSDVTRTQIKADVPHDNFVIPFTIVNEASLGDQNGNKIKDPLYFYYDLSLINSLSMKVYVQYATQKGNGEIHTYNLSDNAEFYPNRDADRVRARIVRIAADGRTIAGDWSPWREAAVEVDTPPTVTAIEQGEDRRSVTVNHLSARPSPERRIVGYEWQTRVDFDNPDDEPVHYRTQAKVHRGRVYDAGNRVFFSRDAGFVRVKPVYGSPYGEAAAEEWSDWFEVGAISEPIAAVENIESTGLNRVMWDEHEDPRVNAYVIELSNDPNNEFLETSKYVSRIIREQGEVVRPNNFFDVPVQAKYIRITPAIILDEDNNEQLLGEPGEWTEIEVKDLMPIGEMKNARHNGRMIMGSPDRFANYYEFETRDRFGIIRTYREKSPFAKASGDFVAYRMRAVFGEEEGKVFIYKSEGEWTDWQIVPEVRVPLEPVTPVITGVDENNMLRWTLEYGSELARRYKIPKYSYDIELQDGDGNRVVKRVRNSERAIFLSFPAVRARIRAVKTILNPRWEYEILYDSESDWSPWTEIQTDAPRIRTVEATFSEGDKYITVQWKPVSGAYGYFIEWIDELGEYHSTYRVKSEEYGHLIRFERYRDKLAKIRVTASRISHKHYPLGSYRSPDYAHTWQDVPGHAVLELSAPDITYQKVEGNELTLRWTAVQPITRLRAGRMPHMMYRIIGYDANGHELPFGFVYGTSVKVTLPEGITHVTVLAKEAHPQGAGYYRRAPRSQLVGIDDLPVSRLESQPPVETAAHAAEVITWPEVFYKVTVRERDNPAAIPVVIASPHEYPPDALIPKGRAAYEITTDRIDGYEVQLIDTGGHIETVRTHTNSLSLADIPQGTYEKVLIRYLTTEDSLGVHSEWSDPRGLRVRHDEPRNLLYIRQTGEDQLTAYFADGVRVDYRKSDKEILRAVLPDESEINLEELSGQYRLEDDEIFVRGERWVEIDLDDTAEQFYSQHYHMRLVMQNKVWTAGYPNYMDLRPSFLPGVASSGMLHVGNPVEGNASVIADNALLLSSKPYDGTNPGSIDAAWSAPQDGIRAFSRKYLTDDAKAAVTELAFDSVVEDRQGEPYRYALQLFPEQSQGRVEVKQVGDYRVVHFASGQFVAVHKDAAAGWFLGQDTEAAARTQEMTEGTVFSGTGERAVLYINGTLGRFLTDEGEQGIYEPQLGDRLNRVYVYSGEAATDEELQQALGTAVRHAENYENAYTSLTKHSSRDRVLPQDFLDFYFVRGLQNQAWNESRRTYWELMGMGHDAMPLNSLWTNASWTGNSSLMQQLNIAAHPILSEHEGHDRINPQGQTLLTDRIIPNADWIMGMQTPTDSFYMKVADAMRIYAPDGYVLLDNQQMSAAVSRHDAIIIKRGYEPLEAMTISGGGFTLRPDANVDTRHYNLNSPGEFSFRLPLEEDMKVDPAMPQITGTRVFDQKQGLFEARENVTLVRGEYGIRYSMQIEANETLHLEKASVSLSHLDAELSVDRNPESLPGFPGENSLMVAGVNRVFKARELFAASGLSARDKGQWIDLLDLFRAEGVLTEEGRQIKEALSEVGAVGVLGWDRQGVMYLPGGVDYDQGHRILVKINDREDDADHDRIIEFTDLKLDIPVPEGNRDLAPGESFETPVIHFTSFWARMGVVDHENVPEDLKHLLFDWVEKIDNDNADGLSMETDYAYTESVIALWDTANMMVDKMVEARLAGNIEAAETYRRRAAEYSAAAMRGTISARNADRSMYDTETGLVREDILNTKGIMRFYGTFAVVYARARDFMIRLDTLDQPLFVDSQGGPVDIYDALITETTEKAEAHWAAMRAAGETKDRLREQAHFEIYLSKLANLRVLKLGTDTAALAALVEETETALETETDEQAMTAKRLLILHANNQLDYVRSLSRYRALAETDDPHTYWYQEILFNADRIVALQETHESRANYGGFYQNEQPSKVNLDDNGTKLWALRIAYETVGSEIRRILSRPGLRSADTVTLSQLYQRRNDYLQSARLNIEYWVRVDTRDGHLYGWESYLRPTDYDSQRTPYGNETYRLRGLASWMDLMPAAKEKFDQSTVQHTREREDGRRLWSPRGIKMNVSHDNPGDGNDTSTEVAPTAIMAFVERARGGTFNGADVEEIELRAHDTDVLPIVKRRDPFTASPLSEFGWGEIAALIQLFAEANLIKKFFDGLLFFVKALWKRTARRMTNDRFLFYNFFIISVTAALISGRVLLFNLDKTNWYVIVLMVAASGYALKNVAEAIVRYYRLASIKTHEPGDWDKPLTASLDKTPFREGPKHLFSALSVPLYTTGDDARVSHGTPDDDYGAFHRMATRNLNNGKNGLVFHINDQSPDKEDADGFNPKEYHENYIREMNERHPGNSFFYTHQPGNTDKKFGAVQAMDAWWYALSETIQVITEEVWEALNDGQRQNLRRLAYGAAEQIDPDELEDGLYQSTATDLQVQFSDQGTAHITLGHYAAEHGFLLREVQLPASDGQTIETELEVPRADGLTAVSTLSITRRGGSYVVHHANEDPDGDNAVVREVVDGEMQERVGLLPGEKQDMIDQEVRALLYRFWAARFGGESDGEDLPATTGRAENLGAGFVADIETALDAGGSNAQQLFTAGGFSGRLSRAMVHQSSDLFHNVADVDVRYGQNLTQVAESANSDARGLFPEAFDENVQAWTDTLLLEQVPEDAVTLPFELEVGRRAVPGSYYHLNQAGDGLEVYDNPALNVLDESTATLEEIQNDTRLGIYEKEKRAKQYLAKANDVLRNIEELMPVKKDYLIRYNPETERTEVIEEIWIMYVYYFENGTHEVFFKPERKVRFDTFVGHVPSIGPISHIWRFDNDETVDRAEGEQDTLVRGVLMAGHPRYQGVLNPESGRTVSGYGGMTIPVRVGNPSDTLWTEMASRNRTRSKWDLRHQWVGFGEAQYTGTGIESVQSAELGKAHMMSKGMYLSHDMREPGELGPAVFTDRLFAGLREQGLVGAFLTGRSHPRYPALVTHINENFLHPSLPGHVVFTRYGRPMMLENFLEILAYGAQAGGFGLLDGLEGHEDWFLNLEQQWTKTMGQWKKGDFQWLHDGWGGLDIRGRSKMPGAMPGFTTSTRRTMEQSVTVLDNSLYRLFIGQGHRESPLTEPQKYFLMRTVEEDNRGAVMLLWLIGTLIFAALNSNTYTLLNLPVFSYLVLFTALAAIVGIMKFGPVFKNIKREGLTSGNARDFAYAVFDTVIESIVISGLELWKALVTSIKLLFRAFTLKWVTRAQLSESQGPVSFAFTYGGAILTGLSMVFFVIAVHPTFIWLLFGSMFLGSLILGPVLARVTAQRPQVARALLAGIIVFLAAAGYGFYVSPEFTGMGHNELITRLLWVAYEIGKWSFYALIGITVLRITFHLLTGALKRGLYGLKSSLRWTGAAAGWGLGLVSLALRFEFRLPVIYPIKRNFGMLLHASNRLSLSSFIDYFFTKGIDSQGLLSSRLKAFGNLLVMAALFALPLIYPGLFEWITAGNSHGQIILSATYLGLFFPTGFWVIDRIANPSRPFRIYNPLDWVKAVFNFTSALLGILAGLILQVSKAGIDFLKMPYIQRQADVFVRHVSTGGLGPKDRARIKTTALALKHGSQAYRANFMLRLARTGRGEEKLEALRDSAVLDHQTLDDLARYLSQHSQVNRAEVLTEDEISEETPRKELRSTDYDTAGQVVDEEIVLNRIRTKFPSKIKSKPYRRIRQNRYQRPDRIKVLQALSRLNGAVIMDARNLIRFSQAQKAEVLKLALAGGVEFVIYHRDKVPRDELEKFQDSKNIRIISEGMKRAENLLPTYKRVLNLFSNELNPEAELIKEYGRVVFYRQIANNEHGLLTAALFTLQYGDKFHAFEKQDGVYVMVDSAILNIFRQHLNNQLVDTAA